MDTREEARQQAKAIATVEAFVLRARRVAEHSLCVDRDALRALIGIRGELHLNPETGETLMTRRWPPEEQVESLAARVRPVLLQSDPVHWAKFLKAVGLLLRGKDAEAAIKHIQESKQEWKRLVSQAEDSLAYRVSLSSMDGSVETELSDVGLAWSWFYGDVVHADPDRRATAAGFDLVERYSAAVGVVARAAWLTYAGLVLVQTLRDEGLLALDQTAFDEPVVVQGTEIAQPATAWVGRPGEEPPPAGTSPSDAGWTRLGVDPDTGARN